MISIPPPRGVGYREIILVSQQNIKGVYAIGKALDRMLPLVRLGSPGQAIVEPHFPDCPEGKYAVALGNPGFA
jgi:hypothetical protein